MKLRLQLITALTFLLPTLVSANVIGTDASNFSTITSGLDFITVQSSETLEPGLLNLGLFGNYAKNSLSYLEGATSDGRRLEDSIYTSDLNFGLGLAKNWDMGISAPFLLGATDNSLDAREIRLINNGITEVRANTKFRLVGDQTGGVAVIASVNFGLIRSNPYTGENAGPTYNFELAGDTTINDSVALGLNVGYRLRSPGTRIPRFPVDPYGNQYIASIAGSYLIPETDVKFISEVFGSLPVSKTNKNTDNSQTTLEYLGGIKYDATSAVALHLGAGTRLINGTASPDLRIYLGINWVLGPFWGNEHEESFRKVKAPTYVASRWEEPEVEFEDFENDFLPDADEVAIYLPSDILFAFNSDRLIEKASGSRFALDKLAKQLQAQPKFIRVVIEGYTDSIGSGKYNRDLSMRRAANIKKYLVNKGISERRLTPIGYGESRPIADNGNYQGRKKNRRVEFKLYKKH
ncbi:MAG: OmpA family protein [Oligoflexia bacterium]|nr:OmpA family protein [Oligoflexia bacterium]